MSFLFFLNYIETASLTAQFSTFPGGEIPGPPLKKDSRMFCTSSDAPGHHYWQVKGFKYFIMYNLAI